MNRYKKANEGIHAPEHVKERAAGPQGRRRGYPRWAGAVAAMLAVVLMGGIALYSGNRPTVDRPTPYAEDGPGQWGRGVDLPAQANALSVASYPEVHPFPRQDEYLRSYSDSEYEKYNAAYDVWQADMEALRTGMDYTGVMDGFLSRSAAQFLTDAGTENRVYSPLNVYLALSMVAETAGDNSRAQILDLLQADSIEALRERANGLWRDNYRDDGVVTAILGNSLWLRDGMTYRQETLDILAKNYFASSFSGKMGTEEYNQALRDWINEQTNGLLAEQARGLGMDADTVLALASTLYFKAAWNGEFQKENTGTDTFHALSGDVDGPFMRRIIESGVYYWGERFAAVELRFQEGGSMWLILPDEGDSVDDLLKSGEAMDFLLADKGLTGDQQAYAWPDQKVAQINLSMPKFDVSSDLSLVEGLKELGVTDVFDPAVSNFDPLGASTDDPLYVSQAQHAARVKVDEAGCEAAAFTVVTMNPTSAAPPNDEVDFTLDRPFLFAVTGDSGLPLFTGVVNQPNG